MAFMLSQEDLGLMAKIVLDGFNAGCQARGEQANPYPQHWWDGIVWANGYRIGMEARNAVQTIPQVCE